MEKFKSKKTNLKKEIFILFIIVFILVYYYLFNNTNVLNKYFNNYFKIEKDYNIKSRLLYESLNKIVSLNDINNYKEPEEIIFINKNENVKNETLEPQVYIYNTHDTEKYAIPYISDYSITPTVKIASYIFKEHLNNNGIGVIVENKKIKNYLTKHNLNYYGCYDASRSYIKSASKKINLKY